MFKKSVNSLIKTLNLYAGCEFDVRLTKDNVPIIQHDAKNNKKFVCNMSFNELKDIISLESLINNSNVINLVNKEKRTLWIELKEDSRSKYKRDNYFSKEIAYSVLDLLINSNLDLDNIRIISFSTEILKFIKDIKVLRIIPYLYTGADSVFLKFNIRTFQDIFKSLKIFIYKTQDMGFNGLLFSKKYLKGFLSISQSSIDDLLLLKSSDFILGTEAQTLEEELLFKKIYVFTDYEGKRNINPVESKFLIYHKGG